MLALSEHAGTHGVCVCVCVSVCVCVCVKQAVPSAEEWALNCWEVGWISGQSLPVCNENVELGNLQSLVVSTFDAVIFN